MLNTILATLYERDFRKLIEEVNLFKENEEDPCWKVLGSVKNSSGNLVLHLIKDLVTQLEELIPMVTKTLDALTQDQMEAEYPIFFDKPNVSTSYVLIRLLAHLGYHLGQVNYLRRILE